MTIAQVFRRSRGCGLLLAMLALVSQVALGAVVWPGDALQHRIAALEALSVVCQGGTPSPRPRTAPHPAEAALCPPAAAFAVPHAVLAGGPTLPPRRASLALAIDPPPPLTSLPGRVPAAAWPRGPPLQA